LPFAWLVVDRHDMGRMAVTYTAEEKFKCASRECEMRKRVYPRWIEQGKITQEKAARETAMMAEIADDYRELAVKEGLL
jgi:hypothetical protein